MKVYGILVRYCGTISSNINEAFKTYDKAVEAVLYKIQPTNLHTIDKYNLFDLSNKIHYEIKEIDLEEE